jgi:hypothetical protein
MLLTGIKIYLARYSRWEKEELTEAHAGMAFFR